MKGSAREAKFLSDTGYFDVQHKTFLDISIGQVFLWPCKFKFGIGRATRAQTSLAISQSPCYYNKKRSVDLFLSQVMATS